MRTVIINTDFIGNLESASTMENCIFTNIVEQDLKSRPPFDYYFILNLISLQWDLDCAFTNEFAIGESRDAIIAQNILINSVKYN